MLTIFNLFTQSTIIAGLSATTFIVFTMPSRYAAQPKNFIWAYLIGIVVGVVFFLIYISIIRLFPSVPERVFYIICGALAVGVAIFVMVITDTEHPPSVGLSLGLVIGEWNHITIIMVLFCIAFMVIVKRLLRDVLIDLR